MYSEYILLGNLVLGVFNIVAVFCMLVYADLIRYRSLQDFIVRLPNTLIPMERFIIKSQIRTYCETLNDKIQVV